MAWGKYDEWNSAIAETLYSEEQAGVPAYLDLEDDVLAAVAAAVGDDSGDPTSRLVADVAATVDAKAGPGRILRDHSLRLRHWERGDQASEPPHLALLAVLSLAAERMANGEGMSANNYYGRLAPMLGMPRRSQDLAHAYRSVAEWWWSALNLWLEKHDGRRGLPTAYSLSAQSHRYIGLPISQALVRAADRDGLVRFFQRVGFAPGSEVPPQSLLPLLDAWIRQNPSPATRSLQRMWSKAATRDRVAEVAAVALAAWDGTVSGRTGERAEESLRLTATVGGLLRPRLEVGVLAFLEHPDNPRPVQVTTAEGDPGVTALPTTIGAMRLAGIERADLGSLLDGVLTIEDTGSGRQISRRPRRVVPMRQHDLLQVLVEADQVQAGEDLVLLVDTSLQAKLEDLLAEVARPGWRVAGPELGGVPERWLVVRDVQVLRSPSRAVLDDLKCLIPLTQSQLTLAGGFSVPGRLRRWHSWAPPEIRALDDSVESLQILLTPVESQKTEEAAEPAALRFVSDEPGALIVDLVPVGLDDGDYRVELYRGTDDRPKTSLMLRLRSGSVPDTLQWAQAPALGHSPSAPLSMLTALPADDDGPCVRGAVAPRPAFTQVDSEQPLPSLPAWWEGATVPRGHDAGGWRVAATDPTSCMFTGRHYLLVPEAGPGKPASQFINSTCRDCGLVKRVATSAWAARKRTSRNVSETAVAPLDVSHLVEVRKDDPDRWGVAMDTLSYLGGGDYGLLEKVALQVEASALFVDHFLRTLEVLGQIEVARDRSTLAPIAWEVTPTALAQTTDGRWSLVGYWPAVLTNLLQQAVEGAGGQILCESAADGPQCWFLQLPAGCAVPDLSAVGEVSVVADAAEAVAAWLMPLSDVVAALPRRSGDMVGEVTAFQPIGARWVPADGLGLPGSYRVRRWSVLDVIRTSDDIADDAAAISTVQFSKHAAAGALGRPLVSYDPQARQLVVPLGADLPGMFGRAAVLASGFPPTAQPASRRLVYRGVSPSVALVIADRLST
ncbi:MAG: hypothetical protein ACRDOY_03170 [Nocardioidaceae bacterium]